MSENVKAAAAERRLKEHLTNGGSLCQSPYVGFHDDLRTLLNPADDGEAIGWQPIETAPKDGTPILGFAGDEYTVVFWNPHYSELGYWDLAVCGAHAIDGEWNPTHWMPLPKPPKSIG